MPRRVAPAGTGYVNRLYELQGLGERDAQRLEEVFFRPVDNYAALALERLEGGDFDLDARLRTAWSRFVMSLRLRTPADIQELRRQMQNQWMFDVQDVARRYADIRRPNDPEDFMEFVELNGLRNDDRLIWNLVTMLIEHDPIVNILSNMRWAVFDIPEGNVRLVTSDRPVVSVDAWGHEVGQVALPIGPQRLFFAANRAEAIDEVRRRPSHELVRQVNSIVAEQALTYGYAETDYCLEFMQGTLGTRPVPSLLERLEVIRRRRDEQRREP